MKRVGSATSWLGTALAVSSLGLGLASTAGCNDGSGNDDLFSVSATASAGTEAGDAGGDGDGDGDGDGADAGDGDGDGDGDGGPRFDVGSGNDGGGDDGMTGGSGCSYIDVLFVVDISASMSQEKDNLNANFPAFVQVLDDYVAQPGNNALGYRLGVTNSSIVQNNAGQSTFGLDGELYDGEGGFGGSCNIGGRWIDGPGADVSTKFSCLAPQPKSPCSSCTDLGKERPLDTLELFIDKSAAGGVNEGFYRGSDSLFVLVLLSDEDDDVSESLTTPTMAKAALDGFVGGQDRHVVVSIVGPESGGCNSAFGSANAAPRLHEFTKAGPNGVVGDICQGDLAMPLEDALDVILQACNDLPPPAG